MLEFRSGQPTRVAHQSLKAAIRTMEKAQNCAVLWFAEIMRRSLYRDLGYSSINQYGQQELGYTKAREVVKVADKRNQKQWLEVAQNKSRRELEVEVKRAKQAAVDQAKGQGRCCPNDRQCWRLFHHESAWKCRLNNWPGMKPCRNRSASGAECPPIRPRPCSV